MPSGMRGRIMPPDPGPDYLLLDVAPALAEALRTRVAPRAVLVAQTSLTMPDVLLQRTWGAVVLQLPATGWDATMVATWGETLDRLRQRAPLVVVAEGATPALVEFQVRFHPDQVCLAPTAEELDHAVTQALLLSDRTRRRPTHTQTVLAIGAHPDDVEIAIGGILSRHVEAGDTVVVLVMTDGEEGGPRAQRLSEAEQAATVLGARLIFGHLRDTLVGERADAISVIEAAVSQWRPQVVYTHTLADKHQDHRTVHRATMVAARAVPNVYGYQAPSSDMQFHPQTFVDITDHFDRKVRLVEAHRTQVKIRPYMSPEHLRSTAMYWGRFAGYRLVEPLEVYREVV